MDGGIEHVGLAGSGRYQHDLACFEQRTHSGANSLGGSRAAFEIASRLFDRLLGQSRARVHNSRDEPGSL